MPCHLLSPKQPGAFLCTRGLLRATVDIQLVGTIGNDPTSVTFQATANPSQLHPQNSIAFDFSSNRKLLFAETMLGHLEETRTPIIAVKGQCPRPLDDEVKTESYYLAL